MGWHLTIMSRGAVLFTASTRSHQEIEDIAAAARRLRPDPRWRGLAVPLVVTAALSAALLALFYAGPHQTWDGLLQRIAVSLPLAAIAAVSVRLLTLIRRGWL